MKKFPDKNEVNSWIRTHWRPSMAFVYMGIIIFDFVIAPILWSLIQYYGEGSLIQQWSPLTLAAGGLFHAAMGAILGVSAFTRGQEKIQRIKQSDKYVMEILILI
jgi:hypothetical protein